MKSLSLKPRQIWLIAGIATVAVLVAGYFFVQKKVRPWAKALMAERANTSAVEFLAKNDPLNALLLAQRTLQGSPNNAKAWEIGAAAAKRLGRTESVYYQNNLTRISPTKENYLELIRLCVQFGYDALAIDAIRRGAAFGAKEPEFYRLAAKVNLRQGRTMGAKYYLIDLTALDPTDQAAQLDLAEIEVKEDPPRKNLSARDRLKALSTVPALRPRALSVLLADSVQAKLRPESEEWATQLEQVLPLPLEDQLMIIRARLLADANQADALFRRLQKQVEGKTTDVARAIDFMGENGRDREVGDWYRSLPTEIRGHEQVKRAVADSFLRLQNWDKLREVAQDGTWPSLEFLRRAFLAHSFKAQKRSTEFDEAWKGAVLEAGQNLRSAVELLRRVEAWRWQRERYDVIWRLFGLMPENKPARDQLMAWERSQNNTVNLNRIFARIVEINPTDKTSRNNYAYSSLLLDANVASAALIAKELTEGEPDNIYFATTYAFALFRQGKIADALKKLESLGYAALVQPERMALHAVLLARSGQFARADELAKKVVLRGLLPEEQKLVKAAELELDRHNRSQGNESRLKALRQTVEPISDDGWLVSLPASVKTQASVDMQLADSLFARNDLKALQEHLRNGQWGNMDYLRQALLAYCRRADNPVGARDAWARAVLATQRETGALENLQTLVTRWKWTTERIEVLNQLHVNAPTDRARFEELLAYYRERKRTPDLLRVLRPWIEANPSAPDKLAFYYYALLTNLDTSEAMVSAKAALDADPGNADWQVIYALSLWRQDRAPEASMVLRTVTAINSSFIPLPLVNAIVDAELGKLDDARKALALFDQTKALPEEVELARKTATRLADKKQG